MKRARFITKFPWVATTLLLLLAGCAPVISPATLQQVDKSISFEELQHNPDKYKGKTVLLGGDIIETRNTTGRTVILVLARSLDHRNQPKEEGASKGRFIVYQPGFLDPAIYRPDRQITVAGKVIGKELRPIGEMNYSYPVIENRELYLWPTGQYPWREPPVHFGIGIGIGL